MYVYVCATIVKSQTECSFKGWYRFASGCDVCAVLWSYAVGELVIHQYADTMLIARARNINVLMLHLANTLQRRIWGSRATSCVPVLM